MIKPDYRTCLHCGSQPDHKLGLDCVRFICGACVDAAVRPHGRSLHFPHDEQEEFLITSTIPTGGSAQ